MRRPHRSSKGLAVLAGASTLIGGSDALLDLSTSISRVCAPLNVTWTPQSDGYPYSVWISGIRGAVDSYRINSDYQPNSRNLTFQYVVPPPATGFSSYVVVVADNKGNGNTTRPMSVVTGPGSPGNNCDPFTATPAWTWAGDPKDGGTTMKQCKTVRFYNIDNRGTAPFSITWLPVEGVPITVDVPKRATRSNSDFIYETIVPFAAGTQFQLVLGDAFGGPSGGASELYTTADSDDASCLANNYVLLDRNTTRAIPSASNVATFKNLAGAVDGSTPAAKDDGGGSNVGAIAGGAIGGAIAVAVVIGCLIAYFIYKKRQKAKKEEARKEEVHFVDLDGDDDEHSGAEALTAARRSRLHRDQRDAGVQQTYSVSPFTYQVDENNAGHDDRFDHEMTGRPSRTDSFGESALGGRGNHEAHGGQYGELLAAAGMARVPSSTTSAGRPPSSHSFGSNNGLLASPGSPVQQPVPPLFYSDHTRSASNGSAGAYRLRTTNDDTFPTHTAISLPTDAGGPSSSSSTGQAGPLPQKSSRSNEQLSPRAQTARRVVMHLDGGPLPQPESDDEALEELPPQYGGWADQGASRSDRSNPPRSD